MNSLEPGQTRIGHLIDGIADTPYQAAMLEIADGNVLLSVPYVPGERQFLATEEWFTNREPPPSLIFHDGEGAITLTGLRWRGHSMSQYSTGRIWVDAAIFELPKRLRPEFRFREVVSELDGLRAFAGFRSIEYERAIVDGRLRTVATIAAHEDVQWRYGGFSFRVRANAPWQLDSSGDFRAASDAVVGSSSSRRATLDAHITAQWPIRALLLLAYGRPLRWRAHRVRDDDFPRWMLAGPPREPQLTEALVRRTLKEFSEPAIDGNELPIFHLNDLGSQRLRRWMKLYSDPVFRRAIEPTVEVINGASKFLEPQILLTVLGLDAMGHYRDQSRRRNVRLHEQIERCVRASGIDLNAIGSPEGIARALSNVNNDLKHPDRPNRPDSQQLRLAADLSMLIMRSQVFDLLGLSARSRQYFAGGNEVYQLNESFRLNDIFINDDGHFVPRPGSNQGNQKPR